MARYKVRLDDGSEIVLELQAVKDWYTQGLLTRDSPVLKPGASQWLPLARALQLVGPPAEPPRPAGRSSASAPRRTRPPGLRVGTALRLALACLVALGVALGAWRLLGGWAGPAGGADSASGAPPQPSLDQIRSQSVEAVRREVPLFSAVTAERLVRQSQAQALAPEEAFRRGFRYAALGVAALTPAEAREMTSLTSAAYARVGARERSLLGAYLEKLRAGRPTSQAEDREASLAMKRALDGFPAARLERLQQLYAKAVEAGLARD
jgi:hypothetical protein